jgi:ABC-type antimicrobial peptide transport system permease subunit
MAVFSLALLLGAALTLLGSWALADVLRGLAGIQVQWRWPTTETWLSLLALGGMALLSAGVPAWRALRLSLSDGLNPPHA